LLGATPKQLRGWGYDVTTVANVDDRISACVGLVFQARTQCWAELDRYLSEEVAVTVPLLTEMQTTIRSERVTDFAVDQSAGFPIASLDRLVVPPGSVDVPAPEPIGPIPPIPAGTYEMVVTPGDVREAVPDASDDDVGRNTGPWRLTLDGAGGWYIVQWPAIPDRPWGIAGTYSAEGPGTVVFRTEASEFDLFDGSLLSWELEGANLRFTMEDCRTDDPYFCAFLGLQWTSQVYRRVDL
jgi:hypothetical protein